MNSKYILLLILSILTLLSIASLVTSPLLPSSIVQKRLFRIIFLYYIYDEAVYLHFEYPWQYNTEATLGLEFAIGQELKDIGLSYEGVHFQTNASREHLNKTFLDSADLIVVGGLSYWWNYASEMDKVALFQTSTPIIASICYGDADNATMLNILSGSRDIAKPHDYVLYSRNTLVKFSEHAPVSLRNCNYSAGFGALVNVNEFSMAKVYAYGVIKETGQEIPLLIFNGTKNFLINAFTYRGTKQYDQWELGWPKLLIVALDELFDILPDDVLSLRISPKPEVAVLRISGRYLVIDVRFIIPICMLGLFIMLLVRYRAVRIDFRKLKLKLRISVVRLRVAALRAQQVTLILLTSLSLASTYMPDASLVIQIMFQQTFLACVVLVIFFHILDLRYEASLQVSGA